MVFNCHRNPSSRQAAVLFSSQRLTSNAEGYWNMGFFKRNDTTQVPLALSLGVDLVTLQAHFLNKKRRDCERAILTCRSNPQNKPSWLVQVTGASPTVYTPTPYEVWALKGPNTNVQKLEGQCFVARLASQVPPSSLELGKDCCGLGFTHWDTGDGLT
ncbi:hypothetical protein BKA70DRAFT_1559026 [Coprinopsis sp. MPI-PUGE-AT-0042]|nr:hypothetical protein BKA70DRAFT_1559026 [Coprinopsis sp. MPI-PUGE-AT-0042]